MRINRESWLFVTGQAGQGKTDWIKKHLRAIPAGRAYIYDFNRNDYQEFVKSQNIWMVDYANQKEIEHFLRAVYSIGNCFTVLEEADNYLLYPSDFIRQFVNTARNRGIGCMVNAKRAMAVQPVFRTRFTNLVLFRCIIPEDIAYLEKWAGTGKGSLEFLHSIGCTCETPDNCTCGKVGEHVVVNLAHQKISEVKKL